MPPCGPPGCCATPAAGGAGQPPLPPRRAAPAGGPHRFEAGWWSAEDEGAGDPGNACAGLALRDILWRTTMWRGWCGCFVSGWHRSQAVRCDATQRTRRKGRDDGRAATAGSCTAFLGETMASSSMPSAMSAPSGGAMPSPAPLPGYAELHCLSTSVFSAVPPIPKELVARAA